MPEHTVDRPTVLLVGHMGYSIEYLSEKKWLKNEDADKGGSSWYATGEIKVRTQNQGQQQREEVIREILLHEIIHVAWNQQGMTYHGNVDKDALEEWTAHNLAFSLMPIMTDNPEVFDYILGR